MILTLLATLGAIVVAFILYPIFSQSKEDAFKLDATERKRLDLIEQKARLYESIQDLDFEKASGKLSENDYNSARSDYLTQVAELMSQLDTITPSTKRYKKKSKGRADKNSLPCSSCGKENPEHSRFCLQCGKPFSIVCPFCSKTLPATSRFCNACGKETNS